MNSKKKQDELKLTDLEKFTIEYCGNNHQPSTTSIYKRVCRNLLVILGDKKLDDACPSDMEYYKSVRKTQVKETTVNIEIRTIKAMFNLAINEEFYLKNPAKKTKQFKSHGKKPQFISKDEYCKLISKITDKKFNTLVYTAYFTGMRLNEIINLRWRDVDLHQKIIHITNSEDFITKTGKNRDIPMSDKLFKILCEFSSTYSPEKISGSDDYVFSNSKGGRHNKCYVSRRVKKYIIESGIGEQYHFHSLRHTCLSQLSENGIGLNYIKEIAGHASIKTTELYLHTSQAHLRTAMNTL